MPDPVYKGKAWMCTTNPPKKLTVFEPLFDIKPKVWHLPPPPTMLPETGQSDEEVEVKGNTTAFPKPSGLVKKWETLPTIRTQKEVEKQLPQSLRFVDQAILLTKKETGHLLK